MLRNAFQIVLLALATSLLSGCLSLTPPKVAVESIEVIAVSSEAMAVSLHGTVANPHASQVRLLEFDYSLSVDGRSVFSGRHAAEMALIPGADRKIMLPASFPYAKLGWDPQSLPDTSRWSMSGSLIYLGEGVLAETLLDMGYRPSTGMSASGELVLQPPG